MASEYGWAKSEILDGVYLDELFYLANQINKRKIGEYKILTAIAQSPHLKEPRRFWELLDSIEERDEKNEQMDVAGFEILKSRLRSNPRMVIK